MSDIKERDYERNSNASQDEVTNPNDPDAEFGGTEARKALEKKLLRKVDARMSIMVLIYILNYVSSLGFVIPSFY